MNLYETIDEHIRAGGRHLMGVFGGEGPAFTYTIGHHLKGQPELLLVGPAPNYVAGLLNHIGDSPDLMAQVAACRGGELLDAGGKFPLKMLRVGPQAKAEYTVQATRFYGHADYDVVQLVAPDKQGRFPGEADCEAPWSGWGDVEDIAS